MSEATLELRLRAIEDRLEIYNLIAAHPPSADTGAAKYTLSVWTEDGSFDRQIASANGRAAIAAGLETPGHQAAIAGGIAHFTGLPHIAITGDTAIVTSYLQILVPQQTGPEIEVPNHGSSKGFRIHRLSANRWELVRTAGGWKIARRALRVLDDSAAGRDLLRQALAPLTPP